jgi:hypothetical protein
VTASQEAWRSVRRYLNGHRAKLAKLAQGLYEPEMAVPDTPLLTRADWMPSEPALLEDVALRWEDGSQITIDGTEPEARPQFPLRTADYFYDRYTAAIRYLEAPSLFENRPSDRLLQIDWDRSRHGTLVFGPAAYFDKLDICETLGHEFAAVFLKQEADTEHASEMGWRHLPFRHSRRPRRPFLPSRHSRYHNAHLDPRPRWRGQVPHALARSDQSRHRRRSV